MAKIRITDETMNAIRSAACYEFRQTGQRQADGTWLIDLDDQTRERLGRAALTGETLDDTIQRLVRFQRGDRTN